MMSEDKEYQIYLTASEMRAVVKSLGIGIDQLVRKADRVSGLRRDDIIEDCVLLSQAKLSIEEVLIEAIQD
jgi:hypothetical protein